jgi:uncharacterized membrane protein YqjE
MNAKLKELREKATGMSERWYRSTQLYLAAVTISSSSLFSYIAIECIPNQEKLARVAAGEQALLVLGAGAFAIWSLRKERAEDTIKHLRREAVNGNPDAPELLYRLERKTFSN